MLKKWDCPMVLDYNDYATPTLFMVDRDRKIFGKQPTITELKKVVSESTE